MSLAAIASSKSVQFAAGGWTLFVAENFVLSENRSAIIEAVGETAYRSAYGTFSTLSLASVAYGRWQHGAGPQMYAQGRPGLALRMLGLGCTTLGLVGFANLAPTMRSPLEYKWPDCPFDFAGDSKAKAARGEDAGPTGLQRVTRHPSFWSLGLFSCGLALSTPFAGTAAVALGPAAVALFGGAHMDSRHRRGMGGNLSPERDAVTSLVPFVALLSGAQSWTALCDELKPTNCAAAALLSALVFALRGF